MITEERPDKDDDGAIDQHVTAELVLLGIETDEERVGRVIKRSWALDGLSIGRAHPNLLFNTCTHHVEVTYDSMERYQANVIAKKMFSQIDEEQYKF
eukprot:8136018-Ditylum_brightwellii.AAC.1